MAEETHLNTNDARAGSTPGIVRYVLAVSLGLAIGAMVLLLVFSYQV